MPSTNQKPGPMQMSGEKAIPVSNNWLQERVLHILCTLIHKCQVASYGDALRADHAAIFLEDTKDPFWGKGPGAGLGKKTRLDVFTFSLGVA